MIVDDSADSWPSRCETSLWVTFTRANPAADVEGIEAFVQEKHWGCRGPLVIDARLKPHHAPPLVEDPDVTRRVDALAARAGRFTESSETSQFLLRRQGHAPLSPIRRRMSYTYPMYVSDLLLAVSARTVDHALTRGLWWFVVIWLGCLGGCVGSFLNVVWDRMGTGEGIVLPRSRCPECDHPLRWYHNLADRRLGDAARPLLRLRLADFRSSIRSSRRFFAAIFIAIGLCCPLMLSR